MTRTPMRKQYNEMTNCLKHCLIAMSEWHIPSYTPHFFKGMLFQVGATA